MSAAATFKSFSDAMARAFTKPEHFDSESLQEYYAIFKDSETGYPTILKEWIEFMFSGWDQVRHGTMLKSKIK